MPNTFGVNYTFKNAVDEILQKVNDADGDVYFTRAKKLVFEGINMLISTGDYIEEDIPYLIKESVVDLDQPTLVWTPPIESDGSASALGGGQLLKILGLTSSTNFMNQEEAPIPIYTWRKIDDDYLNKMRFDVSYKPLSDEIFYIINRVSPESGYTNPGEGNIDPYLENRVSFSFFPEENILSRLSVNIRYIKSPREDSWIYGNESGHTVSNSSIMSGYLSMPFIYKVINYAATEIKKQQAGE